MTRKKRTVCFGGLVLLMLVGALLLGVYLGGAFKAKTPVVADGTHYANEDMADYSELEENPSISVPGFDSVYLKADEVHQYFTFNNPKENTCYFEIVLAMESGKVLWTSDYLKPAMAISEFDLNQTLDAGRYENATLTYNCYSLKNLSKLNSGAVKVTLIVE